MMDDTARFLSKVDKSSSGGCWVWIGALDGSGYGTFYFQGRKVRASRWAYERWIGPLGDQWALHHCDNPPCVNPEHLFIGDHTANMLDASAKGRHGMQVHPESSRLGRWSREKTHCPQGHPYDENNTRINTKGRRECWECRRTKSRERIRPSRSSRVVLAEYAKDGAG